MICIHNYIFNKQNMTSNLTSEMSEITEMSEMMEMMEKLEKLEISVTLETYVNSEMSEITEMSETSVVTPLKFTPNEYSKYSGPFSQKSKFKSPEEEHEWCKNEYKLCNKCNISLPLTQFGFNTSGQDPFDKNGYRLRRGDCIDCNKHLAKGKNEARKIAKESGIPYKAPDGTACEICNRQSQNIVFDHHHEKNIFRGWLCNECNRSIGMLGENTESILKVLNYMNKIDKIKFYYDENDNLLKIKEDNN